MTAAGVTPSSPTSTYAYGYTDANWGDKLTSYRGQTITYDEIGNPLSYYNGSSYTFTWQNGRQLATVVKGSRTLSFEYNSDGIRTSKTVNGVEHVYYLNGSRIIAELWGNSMCIYLYDNDGSPIGMQYRTTSYAEGEFDTFWFTKNVHGDIVSVYNDAGTKLLTYHYDSWGNFFTQWHTYTGSDYNASYNPFKYRGYYHDSETGFYYLNSRYYDPVTCRFINTDAFVNANGGITGYNMFAYCSNNPVMYKDPSGKGIWDDFIIFWDDMKELGIQIYEDVSELVDLFRLKDGTYALHDNLRDSPNSVWHEQILVFDPVGVEQSEGFNSELEKEVFLGLGGSFTAMTGGWELGALDISLFDICRATAQIGIGSDGFVAEIGASLFSPSVSLDIGLCTFTVGMNFGVQLGLLKSDDKLEADMGILSFGVSITPE